MFAKYLTAGAVGSLLMAGAAFAEPPATVPESSLHGDWRASKVVGLNVYNEANEDVGSINELLMDKSGNIKAAVLSVGGFLGMGSHYVAVPFDKITRPSRSPIAAPEARPTAAAPSRTRPRARRAPAPRRPTPGTPITPCSARPRTT